MEKEENKNSEETFSENDLVDEMEKMVDEATKDNPVEETEEVKDVKTVPLEQFQRLQAEFSNFQNRIEKERLEIFSNANSNLISKLLEVLDNFELSLKHNEDKGVALIHDELLKILENQGLKVISTEGKFDPAFHEALMQEDGDDSGTILEEFQKGYLLNDKLLRASKVKISRSTEKNDE